MHAVFRLEYCFLILVALGLPALSSAQSAPAGNAPAWACWYHASDFTLRCVLSRTPASLEPARVEALRQAVDRRLPELVRVIRATPERLATQQIFIPLWNAPYEMDFARQLAEAVMCGGRDDCRVVFDANADGRAPQRAAALRAGTDEAQVLAEIELQNLPLLGPRVPAAGGASRRPRR